MSTTTNLNTLKINYLTQAQYETALGNNQINENELYVTPDSGGSGGGGISISVEKNITVIMSYIGEGYIIISPSNSYEFPSGIPIAITSVNLPDAAITSFVSDGSGASLMMPDYVAQLWAIEENSEFSINYYYISSNDLPVS